MMKEEKKAIKRRWRRPEVQVLVRSYSQEAVLQACKESGNPELPNTCTNRRGPPSFQPVDS
jgi:hypothetical protein